MWLELILFAVSTILSLFLAPKQKQQKVKPGKIEDDSIPIASASTPIPVLFGERWISGPNVVWWGDLKIDPIKKKVGGKK